MSCASPRCVTFKKVLFLVLAVLNILGALALLGYTIFNLIVNLKVNQWKHDLGLKPDEMELLQIKLILLLIGVSCGATCIFSILSFVSLCRSSVCILTSVLVFNLIRGLIYCAVFAITLQFGYLLGVVSPVLVLLIGTLVLRDMKQGTKRDSAAEEGVVNLSYIR